MTVVISFVFAGSKENISGGTIYDNKFVETLNEHSDVIIKTVELDNSFPFMSEIKIESNMKQLEETGNWIILDGLASGIVKYINVSFFKNKNVILLFHNPLHLGKKFTVQEQRELKNMENELIKHCKGIICTSIFSKEYLREVTDLPIYFLPPGRPIVYPNKEKQNNEIKSILSVGSVDQRKNQLMTLKALQKVDTNVKFDIVGPCNDKNYLNQIEDLIKIEKNHEIYLRGKVEDVSNYYRDADLFIHTPIAESYGMVLIEAMGYGLPVITTKVDGIPSTVEDAAILIEPNEEAQLAKEINSLINNDKALKMWRIKALQRFEGVKTWKENIKGFIQWYYDLLAEI